MFGHHCRNPEHAGKIDLYPWTSFFSGIQWFISVERLFQKILPASSGQKLGLKREEKLAFSLVKVSSNFCKTENLNPFCM